MGDEMSQEEIDAMLASMADGDAPEEEASAGADSQPSSGELSQEEIDAMLTDDDSSGAEEPQPKPKQEKTKPKSQGKTKSSQAASSGNNAQSMQFQSFQESAGSGEKHDVSMIMDVKMEVAVELGRASMYIKDILDLGPGSVVEINRMAGEPIELLVNGKVIAKGEVVVIDEKFGLRITELLHPAGDSNPN